jgi:glycosyltransferase involved in cell wall biosynthesis
MSMMPDKKVRKEFQNPSVDIETNLDNNHQVPGKILNEYNLLMDDYFELHYEYSKFKNKPLIQIASKLSKLVPENSKTEHLLQRVIEAFRILSIQGWRELFNRIRIWNRNSKVIKRSIKRSSIKSFLEGEYFEITPEICDHLSQKYSEISSSLPDIIILPFINWNFRFQRPQHLAIELSKLGHRIFYIQPIFSEQDTPIIKEIRPNLFLVKLPNKGQKFIYKSALSKENVAILEPAFGLMKSTFTIKRAGIIVDLPYWRQMALRLKEAFGWKIIYDCMDYHAGFSNSSDLTVKNEHLLIVQADLVFVSSNTLYKKVIKVNSNSILLPNATDFDYFHRAALNIFSTPNKNIPPIIGYYGAIADWFDTVLVAELARAHPEWLFMLIGSTELANCRPFKGVKNIKIFGEKPYSELPKFLRKFDVCIIPFIKSPLTEATNPVKLFEYLSAGKPVVATKLTEISNYRDYIWLAETRAEWESAIIEALLEIKTEELLMRRFNFAKANTWRNRAEILKSRITDLFS